MTGSASAARRTGTGSLIVAWALIARGPPLSGHESLRVAKQAQEDGDQAVGAVHPCDLDRCRIVR